MSINGSIDAIWKSESAWIIGGLTRIVRDIGLAEDLAQDALLIALERWPLSGIPDNPGAWLMTTAKRRAIDLLRRNKLRERKYEELSYELNAQDEPDFDSALDDHIGDDLLRLIFITCHPILSEEARSALTLRLLGGLTTEEIAKAYLVPESTVAQRITRAKRKLSEKRVEFEVPPESELKARLSSVLEVIYLMFNEGYSASAGDRWLRPVLCEEAFRIGRILAEIVHDEPEVYGLVALMDIQASRFKARVDSAGEPILLMDQKRELWDDLRINRGLAALERAERLGGELGPYTLQAAITACHARAKSASETDWVRISGLYDTLFQIVPTPIIELNRAVALSMAHGPEVGLKIVDTLLSEPSLKNYHLLPSVRGDLLMKLGRLDDALLEFKRAAALTSNVREQELLLKRAAACTEE
ncbi:RNA polymerase subunit sigma-24 [Paenibacillus sp. FSL H7-0326]|uniref:RNA polymerase sigma factor n=1 Tax=Paenibacillus sp. FSL H7-0326 TaxID=1921144 RepID=UPI00096E0B3A|nr:RNA polymerase sigma factor [Paenibacillus sp. FSL H7-0326]OMC71706.1 RNA polymerase subunit sigma-24 [Paenibacillus sp. FSL H7-0326]